MPVTVTAQDVGKEARYFFADNSDLLDDQEREFKYSSEATIYGNADGSAPILDDETRKTAAGLRKPAAAIFSDAGISACEVGRQGALLPACTCSTGRSQALKERYADFTILE